MWLDTFVLLVIFRKIEAGAIVSQTHILDNFMNSLFRSMI
jgi:uncharacterized membrane protein